jgi:hypothetical protein
MNVTTVNEARRTYRKWFGDGMSERGIEAAREVRNLTDLEYYRDEISAGEFDAIESAILFSRRTR